MIQDAESKEPRGTRGSPSSPRSSPALWFCLYPEWREEAGKASGSGLMRLGVCSGSSTQQQEGLEVQQSLAASLSSGCSNG